jgi:hypothetical protein
MNARPKRVPRLWCALQGLLPLESCLAAQDGELAWPLGARIGEEDSGPRDESNRVAMRGEHAEAWERASLRNQGGDLSDQRRERG